MKNDASHLVQYLLIRCLEHTINSRNDFMGVEHGVLHLAVVVLWEWFGDITLESQTPKSNLRELFC